MSDKKKNPKPHKVKDSDIWSVDNGRKYHFRTFPADCFLRDDEKTGAGVKKRKKQSKQSKRDITAGAILDE